MKPKRSYNSASSGIPLPAGRGRRGSHNASAPSLVSSLCLPDISGIGFAQNLHRKPDVMGMEYPSPQSVSETTPIQMFGKNKKYILFRQILLKFYESCSDGKFKFQNFKDRHPDWVSGWMSFGQGSRQARTFSCDVIRKLSRMY